MKTTDDKIILEIYRRMFAQSEPKGDFDKMMKSGETKMSNFFMAYYLSEEKVEEILNNTLKEFKVHKRKRTLFDTEILLGCLPCSSKTHTEEERKDYDKRLSKFLKSLRSKE